MGQDRFADRLLVVTYQDDEPVGVFSAEDDPLVGVSSTHPDAGVWVPERLFLRLVYVGKAYSLHRLSLLEDVSERVVLNRPQAEGLLDELAFVADRLCDDLARTHIVAMTDYVARQLRRSGEVAICIEGP